MNCPQCQTAEARIAELEQITRTQQKQIERLLDARQIDRSILHDLAAAAARIVEDDDHPTITHMTELNRQRRRACRILETQPESVP